MSASAVIFDISAPFCAAGADSVSIPQRQADCTGPAERVRKGGWDMRESGQKVNIRQKADRDPRRSRVRSGCL